MPPHTGAHSAGDAAAAAQAASKGARKSSDAAKKAGEFVSKHKKAFLLVGGVGLLLVMLFHKEKYHLLRLTLDGAEAVSEKFTDPTEAEQAAAMCKGTAVTCTSVTKEQKKDQPPKLYDLTTLQREANRLFGYTAKQTLDYARAFTKRSC